MPDSGDGTLLTYELANEVRDMVNAWKRGTLIPPTPRVRFGNSYMPPLRGILLQDLPSDGTADCATTILFTDSTIQEVQILGGLVTGGTFQLGFKGQNTTDLQWNSTAAAMQSALQKLPTIGPNNAIVTLGQGNYLNDLSPTGASVSEFPGLWNVTFVRPFAGRTDTPLLTVNSSLSGGVLMMAVATEQWGDTGKVTTVRAVIPMMSPTPMRAGAVVWCDHMPGVGYCVVACEPRQFGAPY